MTIYYQGAVYQFIVKLTELLRGQLVFKVYMYAELLNEYLLSGGRYAKTSHSITFKSQKFNISNVVPLKTSHIRITGRREIQMCMNIVTL